MRSSEQCTSINHIGLILVAMCLSISSESLSLIEVSMRGCMSKSAPCFVHEAASKLSHQNHETFILSSTCQRFELQQNDVTTLALHPRLHASNQQVGFFSVF